MQLYAQPLKIGFEAGMGISNTLTETSSMQYFQGQSINNYRKGLRFGLAFQTNMGNKSSFHSGLYYSAKGNTNFVGGAKTISYNTLEIPFSFVYSNNHHPKIIFWIGGGAYLGYALNAMSNHANYFFQGEVSTKARFGPINNVDDLRRFEYGAQIQSGLNFKNGLFIRFLAQRQLNNLANKPKTADPNATYPPLPIPLYNIKTLRNELYTSLTVGYLLSLKKAIRPIYK